MKHILLSTTFILSIFFEANAQSEAHQAKDIFQSLEGNFKWQIFKPSENKIIREGVRYGRLKLDSLLLQIEETFNNSEVEMTGLMGYNASTNKYFSINCYNVDMGPHILFGEAKDKTTIEFTDAQEVSTLRIISSDKHEWTYRNLIKDEWVPRDLKISFTRIP